MGLDMYLYQRKFLWTGDWVNEASRDTLVLKHGTKKVDTSNTKYIIDEVAYWRKANAVHQWFVDNVQNGEDDCGRYEVTRKQLEQLRDICQRIVNESKIVKGKIANGKRYNKATDSWEPVLEDGEYIENPEVAEELLPTVEGFFFGGTDYDQWYLQDVKYTLKTLKKLLADEEADDFEYHSSW